MLFTEATSSEVNLHNSLHPMKAEFDNCFIIHLIQSASKFCSRLPPHRLFANLSPIFSLRFQNQMFFLADTPKK